MYWKKKCVNLTYYLRTFFPAEAVAIKHWTSKTRNSHQKMNRRVVSRTAEQFKTYDLAKLGNFKAVNWVFID